MIDNPIYIATYSAVFARLQLDWAQSKDPMRPPLTESLMGKWACDARAMALNAAEMHKERFEP
jgi:hypothetical protein